jgi:uncharacterized protein (TIGR03382 family)
MALSAGTAQAAFFSFASDSRDHAWTFSGSGANIVDATAPNDPVLLMIEDNNGALPALQVSTQFNAQIALTFAGDVNLGGGAVSHNYLATGSFSFIDVAAGLPVLTVNFSNCLYTSRGATNSWFTTGALQGDDGAGATVTMTWSGANLPGYGLAPGNLGSPRGFGFDLTAINTSGAIPYAGQNPGVGLDANSHLPNATWFSESSFSASASVVPAPGAGAVMGLAGLAALRRRRR